MPGSFSVPVLLALVAFQAGSFAVAAFFLTVFLRAKHRRRALVQSLAITSDDDEEWLLRWRRTEKRQTAMQVAYVASVAALAAGSTLLYVFQPHWL